MRPFIQLFIILAFIFATSCNNRKQSKFDAEKEKDHSETAAIESNTLYSAKYSLSLFQNIADRIALKDTVGYNQYIVQLKNIDTLVLYSPNSEEDEKYYSLLGLSCRLNNLEAMKDLVLRGANIKLGSKDEFTAQDALYHAVIGGNVEMVRILVVMGTDVNILYASTGINPLVLSVMNKKHMMAEILLKAGAKANGAGYMDSGYILYPLHEAIRLNDVEMVELLLKYNADISLKDANKIDALTLAKSMKAAEIMTILRGK